MANFFLDNKDLQFHLQHPLMRKIVALKERNYTLKDHHELAPQNFEDAMDNYRRVLEIAGEVCGEVIAPNAEGVDHGGCANVLSSARITPLAKGNSHQTMLVEVAKYESAV